MFKEAEGHCRVPKPFMLDDLNLGTWVGTQRITKDSMSSERKQRLDDIGFVWDPISDAWEEGFSKLLMFKEAEGHCRVAQHYKVDRFNLGTWVSNQRSNQDRMSPERKQRLDDIDFEKRAKVGDALRGGIS